ncbi:unnamed protein product, partial [Mesorhabditis belari]|uniref:G-protein coupled receptors family 1 profile domain-containing protein n=1 Tax=Mesorhabditis belari TaxID=2138241 RepID=A0AAF3J8F1_9BILA
MSFSAWPLVPRMTCVLNPAFLLWLFTGYSIPLAEIILTFDRLWALYFPLSYSRTSLKRVFITINVISLISLLLTIFDIAESWIEESGKTTMISQGCYLDAYTKITYYGSYFAKVLLYLICCIFYMPVLWKVRKIMSTSMNRKMRATVRGSLAIGLLIVALLGCIILPILFLTYLFPSSNGFLIYANLLMLKPWMNVIVALLLFKDLRTTIREILSSALKLPCREKSVVSVKSPSTIL